MTARLPLTLFLIFCFSILHAQKFLRGTILDATTNTPIPKASVFLNNTSIGTTANEEGKFGLSLPAGKYELIVSSIGYQTHNQSINSAEAADTITIKLQVKAPDLEAVIIEPYEKDGWTKWGRWFTDNFIGTSENGPDTRIVNPEVLKFRNSKRTNELSVIAIAPLTIENKSLGYRITYQLENFSYNFKTHYLFYAGYPFFKNLPAGDRKLRRWEAAREEVYYGSMLHFMRALYRNRLTEEGFEVRRLQKIINAEKERVRMVYKTHIKADESGRIVSTINRDSSAYYDRILSQDDYKNVIGQNILRGDSVAFAVDSVTAGFDFDNYLLVIYQKKKVPYEFKQLYPKSSDAPMSELNLINGQPIQISANGSYYNPADLLSTGYWAWWEKMGTMLPFDYKPPKKE